MLFSYDLESVGWASVQLEINSQRLFINPSYLSEPLIDLMNGVMSLLPECVPEDEVKKQSVFEWDSEPAIHKWILTRQSDTNLGIKVWLYKDGKIGEEGKVVFDQVCALNDFINLLVVSLENMLCKYGIVGYKANWLAADFPLSGYLKLKFYVKQKCAFPIQQLNKEEWNEYWHSNLDQEFEMLKNLLS
ncbi:hypothetical protein M3194_00125 [Paenibacillus glycanilyticus]|uniref:hypothetical protein n=1 Tax=Paenibacillus glycanilyticus TaxID=126569 RepID=UPI0020402FC6|nr:hypothetical protein [Paenibacillus glycanilyticus]MCM3625765.1 hypothetical protein [Paenibacillus glycanilyticus]